MFHGIVNGNNKAHQQHNGKRTQYIILTKWGGEEKKEKKGKFTPNNIFFFGTCTETN